MISVGSVRDNFNLFLSPTSFELAEDSEEDRWSEFLILPKIQTNPSPLRGELILTLSVISVNSVRDKFSV